ncbi:MAG: hypothetical protein WCD55_11655 [Bacteroidales bacterium]
MNIHKAFYVSLLLILLPSVIVVGQKRITVNNVNAIPPMDGKLADIELLMISYNFFQLELVNGEPSPSETKMVLLQSKDTLYIAIASVRDSLF